LARDKLQLELTQTAERAKHDLEMLREKTDLEHHKAKVALERLVQMANEREQQALCDADQMREKHEKILH